MEPQPIKKAIISVSDKTGLDTLAPALQAQGVEIISTGGTADYLKNLGLDVTGVEEVTGNPEVFDGRVKTLGFSLFGGILYDRKNKEHQKKAKALGIPTLDLIVCNLYPFAATREKEGVTTEELTENIDIGGVSLIRASAKNFYHTVLLCHPGDYDSFLEEWKCTGGIGEKTRRHLAFKGFLHTYHYDQMIALSLAEHLDQGDSFSLLAPNLGYPLRYGENPHQKARFLPGPKGKGRLLGGKPMSYNNYLDSDGAKQVVVDLCGDKYFKDLHCVAVVKHNNPCGLGAFAHQTQALEWAFRSDETSSFGSIVCVNKPLEAEAAQWISKKFVEVLLAPSFEDEALAILKGKKNLRPLEVPLGGLAPLESIRSLAQGGFLLQEDDQSVEREEITWVAGKMPGNSGPLIHFGITACKYLKSNAVALVRKIEGGFQLVGAGMGNPNRLISVERALELAHENGCTDLSGVLAVSDAFFPFRDNIDRLHASGIQTVVAPGGSVRDDEVIEACKEKGMNLGFTTKRHFRH